MSIWVSSAAGRGRSPRTPGLTRGRLPGALGAAAGPGRCQGRGRQRGGRAGSTGLGSAAPAGRGESGI